MKFQCPLTNLSWDATHWVITSSGGREDRSLLKHYRAKVPHPLFSLKKQELWKLTEDRTWANLSITEKRLVSTAYLHMTNCVISNIPWMLDGVDCQNYWSRLKPMSEWLHKVYHQSLGIPVPRFHIQVEQDVRRICSTWLPAVEQCYEDFQNGVAYKENFQAAEAREIAARRKMSNQMLHTPKRVTILPSVVKYILDNLAPIDESATVIGAGDKNKLRKAWMYCMYYSENKLMAAITQSQLKIADMEELIEALELWDLDNPLRYQVLRIMRSKYQFLVDAFDLVADNDNMVSKFLSSKSIKPGQYQVLKRDQKDSIPEGLKDMLAAVSGSDDRDNPQVEASTRNRLSEIAPTKKPEAKDFTDKTNFLKQLALWNLRQRQLTTIQKEVIEDEQIETESVADKPVFETNDELPKLFDSIDADDTEEGDSNDKFDI